MKTMVLLTLKDNKRNTSKLLLLCSCVFSFLLLIAVVVAWIAWDRSDAAGLAGVVAAPAVTAIGFYSWKAKAENVLKLQKKGLKITMEDVEE